jgi:hypothetical protein
MMRWVLVVLVTGCTFKPNVAATSDANGGSVIDASSPDASPDAPADAPDPVTVCGVAAASTTGTDRGRVGADGGAVQRPPLACTAPQQIVGLALRMSDQDTDNGGRSAFALLIACAEVSVDSTGVGITGDITHRELTANGGFNWTPATLTPMTNCQPGWVVSGLSAHTGPNDNLFLDVEITCAKLGPTGAITMTETIPVQGSLTETQNPYAVECAGDEVLVRLPSRIGAGIDSVNLACSTTTCN